MEDGGGRAGEEPLPESRGELSWRLRWGRRGKGRREEEEEGGVREEEGEGKREREGEREGKGGRGGG